MNETWAHKLQAYGATFDAGRVSAFSANEDFSVHRDSPSICDLSHYGILNVIGDEAAQFLQAQFTNDVSLLSPTGVQLNGWCSPKGRLLTVFSLWRTEAGYSMMLPKSVLPAVQKRLSMFVLRSKVRIEADGDTLVKLGLLNNAQTLLAPELVDAASLEPGSSLNVEVGKVLRLSASRMVLIATVDAAIQVWPQVGATAPVAPASAWDLAMIRDGVVEVCPSTQDLYVPQMANFELAGGVSFKKGCYPGQEIVARTQYRGILKRRMVRAALPDLPRSTPQDVFSPNFPDQAAGSIALWASVGSQPTEALIIAQTESIQQDSLFLDPRCTVASKIALLDLPYSIP